MALQLFRQFLYYFSLAVVAITPLTFNKEILRPFDIPKAVYFKNAVAVLFILWGLWLVLFKQTTRLKKLTPMAGPVLAVVITFGLSTLYSTDAWMSLVGVYERQIGFQGIFSAILLFTVLVTVVESKDELLGLIWAIIATNTLASFHAVLQHLGSDPFGLGQSAVAFTSGVMGHHNFLGNFLAFGIPLNIWISMQWKNKVAKILGITLAIIQLYAVYLTMTRGAYVGSVAGVLALAFLYNQELIKENKNTKLVLVTSFALHFLLSFFNTSMIIALQDIPTAWGAFILLFVGIYWLLKKALNKIQRPFDLKIIIVALSLSLSALGVSYGLKSYENKYAHYYKDPNAFKQENYKTFNSIGRYFSIYNFINTSPRFNLWLETLTFVPKSSLTGIGLETFRREFMAHKSAHQENLEPNTNYDNPHNNFLYYLATTGILGGLAFIWVIARYLWLALEVYRQKKETHLTFALTASMISYIVWNLPGFDTLPILITYWATIATLTIWVNVNQLSLPNFKEVQVFNTLFNLKTQHALGLALFIFTSIFCVWSVSYNQRNLEGDRNLLLAYNAQQKGNIRLALNFTDTAIANNPEETFYHKHKGTILYQLARMSTEPQTRHYYLQQAEKALQDSLHHCWSPENTHIAQLNGRIMLGDVMGAIRAADDALKYSPHLAGVINVRDRFIQQVQQQQQQQMQQLQQLQQLQQAKKAP